MSKICLLLNHTPRSGHQTVNPDEHLLDPRRNVPPADINRYREEALAMNDLFKEFDKEFLESQAEFFYLVSNKWLTLWKHNLSFNEFVNEKSPNATYLGQINLPTLNEDIVVENARLLKYSDKEHYCNVVLKPYLKYEIDYVIVTDKAWKALQDKYPDAICVKRPAFTQADGHRKVEVYLKQVKHFFPRKRLAPNRPS